MKRKRLFVMSGPSGCGKSSWIQKQIAQHGGNWVSRDLIRLSLVEENESYFSHEPTVLQEFYDEINAKLASQRYHSDVYADATHLTPKARREFFRNIKKDLATEVIAVSVPNTQDCKFIKDTKEKADWHDYICSINDIEQMTGYDFFELLEDNLEETLESKIYSGF